VGSTATAGTEDSAKVVTLGTVRTRIGSFGGGSGVLAATPEVTDVGSGSRPCPPIAGLPPANRCVCTWVGAPPHTHYRTRNTQGSARMRRATLADRAYRATLQIPVSQLVRATPPVGNPGIT
jgi:hypothetical protein